MAEVGIRKKKEPLTVFRDFYMKTIGYFCGVFEISFNASDRKHIADKCMS